jgi:hypothetical protein
MNARIAAAFFAVIITACGSAAGPQSAATASSAVATGATAISTVAPASTSSTGTAATPSAATAKVSANNATNAQLIAAFTAAGIPNPSNWAREVQEYRPYDTSDANLTKLRQNLVKYNPAAGVVDKIVATLSLP